MWDYISLVKENPFDEGFFHELPNYSSSNLSLSPAGVASVAVSFSTTNISSAGIEGKRRCRSHVKYFAPLTVAVLGC